MNKDIILPVLLENVPGAPCEISVEGQAGGEHGVEHNAAAPGVRFEPIVALHNTTTTTTIITTAKNNNR